ncbi:hypothetical protein SAMN05216483_2262 [Streptomyces sp. 2131.1]|uniref:hypothetical protein n=1 Tax=Streptomyces sp. 2131.1 TaxID=1855346 RepID=UPI000894F635|nr:hypothetical protein [Streptomyces sp. 2131.1]SEC71895.1 hypothetical protein SAMN05216483_2262 [Streptomyces sp. 2131.1]
MQYPPYPNTSQGGPPLFGGRRTHGWTLVLVTVSALIAGLVGTLGAYIRASGEAHESLRFPDEDVTVTSCGRDGATGRPMAGVRVTSEAARRGTYVVHVVFRDVRSGKGRGVDAGEGGVTVADLAVDATASGRVTGPVPVGGAAECELGDVTFESTRAAREEPSRGP